MYTLIFNEKKKKLKERRFCISEEALVPACTGGVRDVDMLGPRDGDDKGVAPHKERMADLIIK